MKYRVESLSQLYACGEPAQWRFKTEYTDNLNAAMTFSQWAGMFLPHYGLVVNTDTGEIEYEFGATNRDWIKWAFERAFDSLSENLTEVKP